MSKLLCHIWEISAVLKPAEKREWKQGITEVIEEKLRGLLEADRRENNKWGSKLINILE